MMLRLLGFMLILCAAALPVRADEPADSIQSVIAEQIEALKANDLTAAFAHASPTIQSKFGTPESFGQMVKSGYLAIWQPARYKMLALGNTSSGPVQTVLVQDRAGRLFEAAYEMQLIEGIWRINGVMLRVLPEASS
jgi:hypothetical protein